MPSRSFKPTILDSQGQVSSNNYVYFLLGIVVDVQEFKMQYQYQSLAQQIWC